MSAALCWFAGFGDGLRGPASTALPGLGSLLPRRSPPVFGRCRAAPSDPASITHKEHRQESASALPTVFLRMFGPLWLEERESVDADEGETKQAMLGCNVH